MNDFQAQRAEIFVENQFSKSWRYGVPEYQFQGYRTPQNAGLAIIYFNLLSGAKLFFLNLGNLKLKYEKTDYSDFRIHYFNRDLAGKAQVT